jgi:hypothetical protein
VAPSAISISSDSLDVAYVSHTYDSSVVQQGNTPPSLTTSGHRVNPHIPIFHSDEDIMESLIAPRYHWGNMHHRSFLLPQQPPYNNQFVVESKDFIPHNVVDWLKNPIPSPDAFEESNMENI